jgi:hypothetical protein
MYFGKNYFTKTEIHALGGWDASLASMLGLWVNLRPLNKNKRKLLRFFLFPFVKHLFKIDVVPDDLNKNHLMVTGLYGIARK